jgi:hypothetical protein
MWNDCLPKSLCALAPLREILGRCPVMMLQTQKGPRLPGMAEWAKNPQPWQTLSFDQFGFHATVQVKTIHALYGSVQ